VFGRRIRTLVEQNNKLSKENNRIRNELRVIINKICYILIYSYIYISHSN